MKYDLHLVNPRAKIARCVFYMAGPCAKMCLFIRGGWGGGYVVNRTPKVFGAYSLGSAVYSKCCQVAVHVSYMVKPCPQIGRELWYIVKRARHCDI